MLHNVSNALIHLGSHNRREVRQFSGSAFADYSRDCVISLKEIQISHRKL